MKISSKLLSGAYCVYIFLSLKRVKLKLMKSNHLHQIMANGVNDNAAFAKKSLLQQINLAWTQY